MARKQTPTTPRSSGRIRSLVQKQREQKAGSEGFSATSEQEVRNTKRLALLDSDNYVSSKNKKQMESDDDGEVVLDQDEDVFNTRKINKLSKKREADRARRNKLQNFAHVLEQEYYEAYQTHVPTYISAAAAPSKYPPVHL
ncbi:hypothetical protein PROFUN_13479 [Planoprotostelium fungivorum]|uniref:Uncharacterized protein n=1 Tax=Planoprotostelium fungivorum TaxID=1890364 RepID=A0A2P6N3X5_9EUKA|nr:hypothetical protein PROFUN_13479 [Planoprotostelium fungivorum]